MNWFMGVPLAAVFAFTLDYGLVGLQSGFSIAMFGQFIAYLCILLCNNWQSIADVAAERIKKEEQELLVVKSSTATGEEDNFKAAC